MIAKTDEAVEVACESQKEGTRKEDGETGNSETSSETAAGAGSQSDTALETANGGPTPDHCSWKGSCHFG